MANKLNRFHKTPFYVNTWLIEPEINRISRNEVIHKVEPRIIHLITYLANHQLRTCSKEELVAHVWDGVVISDNTLSSAIKNLRKIFRDDWKKPQYIETVSKSGYRLVADVSLTFTKSKTSFKPNIFQVSFASLTIIAIFILLFEKDFGSKSEFPERIFRPTAISSLPGAEFYPKISPDGNQVAFCWRGFENEKWNIYVKTLNSEGQTQLTSGPGNKIYPAWSSDGQYLFYKQSEAGTSAIYKVPLLGGSPIKLIDCSSSVSNLSNSPDGKFLLYDKAQGNTHYIALLDLTSLKEINFTSPDETSFGERNPAFSPDGKQIAFIKDLGPLNGDIFIQDFETGKTKRTTEVNRFITSFDWAQDGNHLVFVADWSGTLGLWRISSEGKMPAMVNITGNTAFSPSHSRKTDRLVFAGVTDDVNIWTISVNSDSIERQPLPVNSSQRDLHPQISPDNSKLAFISDRSGFMELYTCDLNGDNLIQHTNFKDFSLGMPRWSPGSDKLIFHKRTSDGNSDLFYVEIDSKQAHQITFDSSDDLNGSWSRNDHIIYFSSNRSGTWEIWKKDLIRDEFEQLTFEGGFNAAENILGDVVFFVKHTQSGIWSKSLSSSEEELIISEVSTTDWNNWTIAENGIYFVCRKPLSHLEYYDFQTKNRHLVSDTTRSLSIFGSSSITVSADEKYILYNQPDSWQSDIFLLESTLFR